MKKWPLRLKLCLWAVMLGGVTLMAIGAILAWRVRQTAEAPINTNLRTELVEILDAIDHRTAGPIEWADPNVVKAALGMVRKDQLFQVESPPGNVVYKSQPLGLGVQKDQFYSVTVGDRRVHVADGPGARRDTGRVA